MPRTAPATRTGRASRWCPYGSGLVRPGLAMEVAGTSEILAVLSDGSLPTPGIISFPPVHGLTLHAGPTQAGGAALDWAAACFARSPGELLALADEARARPAAPGLPAPPRRRAGARAVWNQFKACAHGRSLLPLKVLDSAVLGAALMGIAAAGIDPDIAVAAERRVRTRPPVEPEPEPDATARLDDLYGAYLESCEALIPVFDRLAT